MLTLPATALLAALVAGSVAPQPRVAAATAIPDEPGVVILPDDASTIQAVVADLDRDGARELVRLVAAAGGAIGVEAWREAGGDWEPIGDPIEVVGAGGGQAELAYVGRPVRLLVRRAGATDRVTLLRQPDFAERGDLTPCCLLLHDVVVDGATVTLQGAAPEGVVADAVHVIDLDGDGTDELLATRSLPPLAGVSYPSEARVYRWADGRFAAPTLTELRVGSGDTPFILGDSDGEPGEEAAVLSTTGRPTFYRLGLGPNDGVTVDDAGFVATDATAVPIGDGRGIAALAPSLGLAVLPWPRGGPAGAPVAQGDHDLDELLGTLSIGRDPWLVARAAGGDAALRMIRIEDLAAADALDPAPAVAALDAGPIRPFLGPLPGGGPDGRPAFVSAGVLLAATGGHDPVASSIGLLGGASPIGLAGSDRSWLAIHHASPVATPLDPRGGRLESAAALPDASVALVPVEAALTAEADAGRLAPELLGAAVLDDGRLAVDADGAVAVVRAPPGSRVHLTDPAEPGSVLRAQVVGESGRLEVSIVPVRGVEENGDLTAALTVVTPAGHVHRAVVTLLLLVSAPSVEATASTAFGSSEVLITGHTAPFGEVTVDGRPAAVDADGRFTARVGMPPWPTVVNVTSRDPLGNEGRIVVSGIGLFDYRALPWIPMALGLVAVAAAVLFVRGPRLQPATRRADDAVLEDLDPGDSD